MSIKAIYAFLNLFIASSVIKIMYTIFLQLKTLIYTNIYIYNYYFPSFLGIAK